MQSLTHWHVEGQRWRRNELQSLKKRCGTCQILFPKKYKKYPSWPVIPWQWVWCCHRWQKVTPYPLMSSVLSRPHDALNFQFMSEKATTCSLSIIQTRGHMMRQLTHSCSSNTVTAMALVPYPIPLTPGLLKALCFFVSRSLACLPMDVTGHMQLRHADHWQVPVTPIFLYSRTLSLPLPLALSYSCFRLQIQALACTIVLPS